MSAGFAKFHPNLVVGGTYSGQIVLWDNRSNKRTPVQRTPLSAAAHTVISLSLRFIHFKRGLLSEFKMIFCIVQHPVYCVSVVGTQNANNLISISTDGKMCSWSLDMLSQPQVGRADGYRVRKHRRPDQLRPAFASAPRRTAWSWCSSRAKRSPSPPWRSPWATSTTSWWGARTVLCTPPVVMGGGTSEGSLGHAR